MNTKLFFLAFLFAASGSLLAQEQQTLFNHARVTGGFGAPIFSLNTTKGNTGFGSGGGGGVVLGDVFVGLFGMAETFGPIHYNQDQLALGYGGLWLGYTTPSYKILHLYTSVKIGGGAAGVTHFSDNWNYDHYYDWPDVVFVAVPEAGVELNVARWFRLSGSVGYRIVGGFEGWNNYGRHDLNAPVYNLTLRFGRFAKRVKTTTNESR